MRALQQDGTPHIELWGGLECTINRVRDQWFDQFEISPTAGSLEAIDLVAGLGIRTLRYPFLWERIAPDHIDDGHWEWADARMQKMREVGITPIAGFMHHGSGPAHSSLLDRRLGDKLARYARAFGERYPDLHYVTPVNEPLTTARFSALYGLWYPHHRSRVSFATALLNQCVAVRESMRALRGVNPRVKLVQTEDVGRVSSTPVLAYQASFENRRRWLTFDLLCGHVNAHHSMRRYLAVSAETIRMLNSLVDDPCPPDILGLNYYVTSDRYLDHRTGLYPEAEVGGNGRHRYVDLETVRAPGQEMSGHRSVLLEAWERYRIPVALTEVHLACTREQQVRWLLDAWEGAQRAKDAGADVKAVTAWALMGSHGWDKLLTSPPFTYESGAFDVRENRVRRTSVASVIRDLATTGTSAHIASTAKPWWRRSSVRAPQRSIIIAGASGTLGRAFARICRARGIQYRALSRHDLDITRPADIARALASASAVINAAGFVRVDDAESQVTACHLVNAVGPRMIAERCAQLGIPFVTFSSDMVFDGEKNSPYVESDQINPLNAYGRSKARAEIEILSADPSAIVIRTSAFFGPWDDYNFAIAALRQMADGSPITLPSEGTVSPTFVPDLVNGSLDLLMDGETGVWQLANEGAVTWRDFALMLGLRAGLIDDERDLLIDESRSGPARHPRYSVLGTERGVTLPSLDDAIDRFFREAPIPQQAMVSA